MKTLILTLLLFGQDFQFKPEYKVAPDQFVVITPESGTGIIKYVPLDNGLNVLDNKLLKNPSTLVAIGKAGKYKVLAYSASNNIPSDPIYFTIVVGDIPKPNNELEEILKSVYVADKDANKDEYRLKMLNGFKEVLKDIDGLTNVGSLNQVIKDKVTSQLQVGQGAPVRSVLKDELSNQFGINPDVTLDKNNAKKVLNNIVDILGRL